MSCKRQDGVVAGEGAADVAGTVSAGYLKHFQRNLRWSRRSSCADALACAGGCRDWHYCLWEMRAANQLVR
jgi:hypothetical protein